MIPESSALENSRVDDGLFQHCIFDSCQYYFYVQSGNPSDLPQQLPENEYKTLVNNFFFK